MLRPALISSGSSDSFQSDRFILSGEIEGFEFSKMIFLKRLEGIEKSHHEKSFKRGETWLLRFFKGLKGEFREVRLARKTVFGLYEDNGE